MTELQAWYRMNVAVIAAVPVLIAFLAVVQISLQGTAQFVAQIGLTLGLVLCTIQLARTARTAR